MSHPRQLPEWVMVPEFILMGQSNNLTPLGLSGGDGGVIPRGFRQQHDLC